MPNPGVAQGSAAQTELCTVSQLEHASRPFTHSCNKCFPMCRPCTGILLGAGVKNEQSQVLVFVVFVFGLGKTFQFSKEFSAPTWFVVTYSFIVRLLIRMLVPGGWVFPHHQIPAPEQCLAHRRHSASICWNVFVCFFGISTCFCTVSLRCHRPSKESTCHQNLRSSYSDGHKQLTAIQRKMEYGL